MGNNYNCNIGCDKKRCKVFDGRQGCVFSINFKDDEQQILYSIQNQRNYTCKHTTREVLYSIKKDILIGNIKLAKKIRAIYSDDKVIIVDRAYCIVCRELLQLDASDYVEAGNEIICSECAVKMKDFVNTLKKKPLYIPLKALPKKKDRGL